MSNPKKPIEEFFLESLLKICLASILIVMAADLYFSRFLVLRSVIVNSTVLFAIASAFLLHYWKRFKFAVLWIGVTITSAMFYQSIESDSITTSSMAVVMIVGFGYSVLLKGKLLSLIHGITLLGMMAIFTWLAAYPARYGKSDYSDIVIAGVTYGILYYVIAYSSWQLKKRYDEVITLLLGANRELIEKTHEIESQNEELIQTQENLYELNNHLESIVEARTQEVTQQNERLIRYAYTNAHHLRGPVARLLGLIQLTKIDSSLSMEFLCHKVEEQTLEIDQVIKGINRELQT